MGFEQKLVGHVRSQPRRAHARELPHVARFRAASRGPKNVLQHVHNPHYAFADADVYLHPDAGQKNIDSDPRLSGFDEIVVKQRGGGYVYVKAAGETLVTRGASTAAAARIFEHLLAEIQ